MDELKQIIKYKLKVIEDFRQKKLQSLEEKQKTVELLLKQKRKQNSRDVIESRLLQSLSSRKIEAPYRVEEFYLQSIQMMQTYSPSFQFRERQGKDQIQKIVRLYSQFFIKQDCPKRAEELEHIFKKNLCQRGMLIPTIFNWFVQWLRKVFRQFIKKSLSELNDRNSKTLIQDNRKIRNKKFMDDLNLQRASLSQIKTQIKNHKQTELSLLKLNGNKSKLLNPNYEIKTARSPSKSEILQYNKISQTYSMARIKAEIPDSLEKQKQQLAYFKYPKEALQIIKQNKEKQKNTYNYNLNKDIFFSAYFEEIGAYYKFYSCLGQLDQNYPRNFRKVDRRDDITKNMQVLVKSLARNQPNQIKNSIQEYSSVYSLKYPKKNMNKQLSNIIKKVTGRAQSVNIKKSKAQQQSLSNSKNQYQLDPTANASLPLKQRSLARIEVQKKRIELELPQIKSFKSVQKIILLNGQISATHRYDRATQKQRVSAELYKQLREISSLFRSRKGIRMDSISIDKSGFEQRMNSIKYKKEKDQIDLLLDGHFQPDGIFRLPKIKK